jgi:hypothetical protein
VTGVKPSDLVEQLAEANLAAVQAAVGCVPLHGAAIDSRAGVIVLAGRSLAGKSTLAAAAVLAGYPYVSDELAAISPDDLTVRPYHRPIGLRRGGASALGLEYPDGEQYGIVYPWDVELARSDGGTLAGIVLVAWHPDATPVIEDVRAPQAMVELTEHTVVPDDDFRASFGGLEQIVRAVPVVRLRYATTAQSLDLLADLVERWWP